MMRISAATSSIVTSTRSSTAWWTGSATGRIRRSTATCARNGFQRIGRATSRRRAASASVFEAGRRNALTLIAPYALFYKVVHPLCAFAYADGAAVGRNKRSALRRLSALAARYGELRTGMAQCAASRLAALWRASDPEWRNALTLIAPYALCYKVVHLLCGIRVC